MRRADPLQSARGVAALVVLVHHCLSLFILSGALQIIAQASEGAAHFAVVFFFVLSGYVLSISLSRRGLTPRIVGAYIVRRGFRMFPALWVATGLGLVYVLFIHRTGLSGVTHWWAVNYAAARLRPTVILASAFALSNYLVIPDWSIFVELVASACIPVIVGTLGSRRLFVALMVALVALSCVFEGKQHFGTYLVDFALGAWISRRSERPSRWFLVAAVLALLAIQALRFYAHSNFHDPSLALVEAIVAASFILALRNSRQIFLTNRGVGRLGDISYSIYVLHFPIMSGIAVLVAIKLATWTSDSKMFLLLVATLGLTLAAAELVFRYVEQPGIAAGKLVSALIERGANSIARAATERSAEPR